MAQVSSLHSRCCDQGHTLLGGPACSCLTSLQAGELWEPVEGHTVIISPVHRLEPRESDQDPCRLAFASIEQRFVGTANRHISGIRKKSSGIPSKGWYLTSVFTWAVSEEKEEERSPGHVQMLEGPPASELRLDSDGSLSSTELAACKGVFDCCIMQS